jgi:pimeloyl-ACP methyl ester carboxylesterase
MRLLTLLLVCWFSASVAQASDYAREARFAQEVQAQLVVGDAVQIAHAGSSSYRPFLGLLAETASSKANTKLPAIVLAHGVGTHPEEGLTGELRKLLHEMGYTTLAIQMPIGAKEATIDDYFPKLFPEAGARLAAAAQFLSARGYAKTVLVSHTMGSWMANVHFDQAHANSSYKAWVCISLTGGYSFATRNYPFPILDVYGENDIGVTVSSAWRRAGLLKLAASGSQQIKIDGADAQWRGKQAVAAQVIDQFFKALP